MTTEIELTGLTNDELMNMYAEAKEAADVAYQIKEQYFLEVTRRLNENNQKKGMWGNYKFNLESKVTRKYENVEEMFILLAQKLPTEELEKAMPIKYDPKWMYIKKFLDYGEDIAGIIRAHMIEEQGRPTIKLEAIA